VIQTFVHRYEIDQSRPTFRSALRDAGLRVLTPALLLFAAITGLGFIITGPLDDLQSENSITRAVQETRTATWDTITMVWSRIGNTEIIIGTCIIVVALVWWRTRQWWYAVVPAIAIAVQASVFVASTTIVGRERPEAAHLDPAPPTSSYPSGHMGAATALYLTFALMAQRLERAWLRRLLTVLCFIMPLLVGYGRLYRGMHYFTDILVGLANGVICCLLAWNYLRRDVRGDRRMVSGGRDQRRDDRDVTARARQPGRDSPGVTIAGNPRGSRRSRRCPRPISCRTPELEASELRRRGSDRAGAWSGCRRPVAVRAASDGRGRRCADERWLRSGMSCSWCPPALVMRSSTERGRVVLMQAGATRLSWETESPRWMGSGAAQTRACLARPKE